ncbi:hypothetical protein BFJ69_g8482 [Fusarium oxysporum]|uniref:Uncharacterized protein n=1 Tax=Fusarium oxysporum TaxID=5507 RepID=A0A420N2P0_FUSOX|nr:hypothetical protein BFJ69_g8482 [Fusarium oxysporum]
MDGHDQQYQVPLSLEAIGSNDCLGLQERRKGRVLTRTIAQAVLEVPVMTTIVDAEAAKEAGKYCKLVAVDFEFDAGRNVGLGMTAATVRGMTDTRNSVGSVQGREVVHVLAAGSGIDCCRTDSSVQYFEAPARALSYTGLELVPLLSRIRLLVGRRSYANESKRWSSGELASLTGD